MKSKLLTLLLVFVLIFSTCSIVMAEEARTIGVIIGAPEAPFFKIVEDGIAAACQELGWETMVTYGKNEKVMEHGRLFISQEVDAIINFGVTTNTGEQLVEEATAAGIPVVDVDVDCGGYFFGANNELAGAVLGDALADYLEENVPNHADLSMKAVMFWSGNEGEVVRMRLTGVVKGLNERGITNISMDNNYENDTIVWQNVVDDSQVKDYSKNQISALEDSTDLIILVMVSDFYGPGAIAAINECGLDKNRVLIVSHNESDTFAENLKDPATPWIASTAYLPQEYGNCIVNDILIKLFAGEEVGHFTLMDHVAITVDNVNDYYPGTV